MPEQSEVTRPDLTSRPLTLKCEKLMSQPPAVLYEAWTTAAIGRWFAAPGTVLIKPEINVPFFFETQFDGQRHPHYGRFLKLEKDRLIELTWLTEAGTKGAETVLTIEFVPSGDGTKLLLTHSGFADQNSRDGHADAWPNALDHLEKSLAEDKQSRD